MSTLNFPNSPTVGDIHTVGDKSWQWNGFAWQVVRTNTPGPSAYQLAITNGFVGTEAEWIASLKGAKGDTGPTGPKGDTGDTGPKGDTGSPGTDGTNGTNGSNGVGVPAGGGSGQVLTKNSNGDFDTHWVTPNYLSDYTVPLGGNQGQFLGKSSAADGDFHWLDLPSTGTSTPELPTGGNTGQVLTKHSPSQGDVVWADPILGSFVPDGGTTGQVLIKQSNANGDVVWAAETGGATALSALTDVDETTGPTNGQALVYDTATSKWKPGTVASSAGSVASYRGPWTVDSNTQTDQFTVAAGVPAQYTVSAGSQRNIGIVAHADAALGTTGCITFLGGDGAAGDNLSDNSHQQFQFNCIATPTNNTLGLHYLVNSENNFDGLTVSVDGVQVLRDFADRTGQTDFIVWSTTLAVGTHTVEISYTADSRNQDGYENVHISQISYPVLAESNPFVFGDVVSWEGKLWTCITPGTLNTPQADEGASGWAEYAGNPSLLGLSDVNGTTAPLNKQVLAYNSVTSKWEPSATALSISRDPEWPYVSMLLIADRGFQDESDFRHSVAANASVTIDTSIKKFGNSSYKFTGTNGIVVPYGNEFSASGTFTAEAWVYLESRADNQGIMGCWDNGGYASNDGWYVWVVNGQFAIRTSNGSGFADLATGVSPTVGQWYHVAAAGTGGTIDLYIDGVWKAQFSPGVNSAGSTFSVGTIGGTDTYPGSPTFDFVGHMDGIRITQGVRRYLPNTNFSVPTAQYYRALPADPLYHLDDLVDVDTSTLADGQALVYNAASKTWKPGTVSSGSSGSSGGSSSGTGAIFASCVFSPAGGTDSANSNITFTALTPIHAHNIASIEKLATARYKITFTTPAADAYSYVPHAMARYNIQGGSAPLAADYLERDNGAVGAAGPVTANYCIIQLEPNSYDAELVYFSASYADGGSSGISGSSSLSMEDISLAVNLRLATIAALNPTTNLADSTNIDFVEDMGGLVGICLIANTNQGASGKATGTTYTVPAGCVAVCIGGNADDQIYVNGSFYAHRLFNVTQNVIAAGFSGGGQNRSDGWNISRSGSFGTSDGGNPSNTAYPIIGVAGDVLQAQAWTAGDGNWRVQDGRYYLAIVDSATGAIRPITSSSSGSSSTAKRIWGVVNTNTGAILAGTGFTYTRTDNSNGTITFTSPLPDTNYGVLFGGADEGYAYGCFPMVANLPRTVNGFNVVIFTNQDGGGALDHLSFEILHESLGGSISSGSGGSSTLAGLTDVDESTSPTSGQALVWDSTTSKWTPGTITSSSGSSGNVSGGGSGSLSSTAAIVQKSPGVHSNGGASVVLPAATTAGNMVLLVCTGYAINLPAGFSTLAGSSNGGNQFIYFFGKRTTGGETTFAVSTNGDNAQWVAYEISNFGGFVSGNNPGQNYSPYNYYVPEGPVSGSINFFAVEHDDSGVFTPDTITGVTYDWINPGNVGNHCAVIGHGTPGWYGFITGGSDNSGANFGYLSVYGGLVGSSPEWTNLTFTSAAAPYFGSNKFKSDIGVSVLAGQKIEVELVAHRRDSTGLAVGVSADGLSACFNNRQADNNHVPFYFVPSSGHLYINDNGSNNNIGGSYTENLLLSVSTAASTSSDLHSIAAFDGQGHQRGGNIQASSVPLDTGNVYVYIDTPDIADVYACRYRVVTASSSGSSGSGSGSSSGSSTLAGLTDVEVTGSLAPTDGQILSWSAADSKWKPATASSGGSGGGSGVVTGYGNHRYWRLFNCVNHAAALGTTVLIGTLKFYSSTNTVIPFSSPVASSLLAGGYSASNVLDSDPSTIWASAAGDMAQWIAVDFGVAVNPAKIGITINGDGGWPAQTPASATLQYSDDNATWTTATPMIWGADTLNVENLSTVTQPEPAPEYYVPAGGTTGQTLSKSSNNDGDFEWVSPANESATAVVPHDFGALASIGGGANYNGGIWFGNYYVVDKSGEIDSVVYGLMANASGINATPAIYSDSGGAPGALLATGPTITDGLAGDNVVPLASPLTVTVGQKIWIGVFQANIGGIQGAYTSGSSTSVYYIANPPAANPAPGCTSWSGTIRIFGRGTGIVQVSGRRFKLPFFFTSTPSAYETLGMIVADETFAIPANFAGDQYISVGINPTSAFNINLNQNGTAVGSIAISTSGVVTLTTTNGLPIIINKGDLLTYTAPSTADTTVANMAGMLWGLVL